MRSQNSKTLWPHNISWCQIINSCGSLFQFSIKILYYKKIIKIFISIFLIYRPIVAIDLWKNCVFFLNEMQSQCKTSSRWRQTVVVNVSTMHSLRRKYTHFTEICCIQACNQGVCKRISLQKILNIMFFFVRCNIKLQPIFLPEIVH